MDINKIMNEAGIFSNDISEEEKRKNLCRGLVNEFKNLTVEELELIFEDIQADIEKKTILLQLAFKID